LYFCLFGCKFEVWRKKTHRIHFQVGFFFIIISFIFSYLLLLIWFLLFCNFFSFKIFKLYFPFLVSFVSIPFLLFYNFYFFFCLCLFRVLIFSILILSIFIFFYFYAFIYFWRQRILRACVSPPPRPAHGAGTFQARCGSFRDFVSVIWGVAESASERLLTGRNGQV